MTRPLKPGEKLIKCPVCEQETLITAAIAVATAKAICDKCGYALKFEAIAPTKVRGVGAGSLLDQGLSMLMEAQSNGPGDSFGPK